MEGWIPPFSRHTLGLRGTTSTMACARSHAWTMMILLVTVFWLSGARSQNCNIPVGMSDPTKVSADMIQVSSEAPGQSKEQIRFNCCNDKLGSAWCPDGSDPNPYVEIHLNQAISLQGIAIQPPTRDFHPLQNYAKTFDLLAQIKGVSGFVTVGKDVEAIANDSIAQTIISMSPPVLTQVVRIQPKERHNLACLRIELFKCDVTSLCADGWCTHGGQCSGSNTCDCTSTNGYFGDRCQYTANQIVVNTFTFVKIEQTTIITTSTKLTFSGSVTLDNYGGTSALTIPPKSYVNVDSPGIKTCMANLDYCLTGFTINVVFSFDRIDSGYNFVLTSGGEQNNVKGISLYFYKQTVNCLVGGSNRLWAITSNFELKAKVWYSFTISWSPGQGLFLLENGKVIGSTFIGNPRPSPATQTQGLIIGTKVTTVTTTIRLVSVTTIKLFWREAERAGLKTAVTTPAPATTTTTLPPTTMSTKPPGPTVTQIGIKDKVNQVITTTDPHTNLTAHGLVTLVKSKMTTVLTLTNGGYVTFPKDVCLNDLSACVNGFTITVESQLVNIKDDRLVLISTGGEKQGSQGISLVYNRVKQTMTYIVKTKTVSWTLTRKFIWQENTWTKLTVSWKSSHGIKLILGGVTIGSVVDGSPTAPGLPSKELCIGCSYVNVKLTSTISIVQILVSHNFIDDLDKANITNTQTTQEKCEESKTDFTFINVTTKQEVVTSLGKWKSFGDVTTGREGNDVILVLNQQGEYLEVSNTGFPCVDDITTCTTDLTYRMTFRFLDFHVEPNFILSSGGDLLNSTGISLYYFHGKLNLWVKDGVTVWRAIYDKIMDLQRWYTIDVSWGHTNGIQLRLDGQLLTSELESSHPADHVNEKHPLHISRSAGPDKDKTSLMELLMFRVWTETVPSLNNYQCDDDLEIHNPVDPCQANMTDVKFQEVERGHDLITSLGTLTTHGNVTVEKTFYKQGEMVLVIDEDGEYVDMGHTGISCLDDVTSCKTNFNFRLTFMFTNISIYPNYILSSGGELNNATGVSLYYFDNKVNFWVKQGTRIDGLILTQSLDEYVWYTLDASWNSQSGAINIYLDGKKVIGFQMPSTPTPETKDKYTLLIGKSPEKSHSTKMNILLFRFWEKTREELIQGGCDKILEIENPPNPTTTTSTTTTTTTTAPPPPKPTKINFVLITGNTLVTTYINMTIHGEVNLEMVPAGQVLVLEKPGSFIDVGTTGVPCLDDVTTCTTGFNFRVIFTLTSYTTVPQTIISNGAESGKTGGITVKFHQNHLYVYVKGSTETQIGDFPLVMTPGWWYTLDVTWSKDNGLELHVNNLLINGTVRTLPHAVVSVTHGLLLAKSPEKDVTTSMRIFEVDFWTRVYNKISRQQLTLPSLDIVVVTRPTIPTTTEDLSTTSTVAPTTTPSPITHAPVKDFEWTLTKVTTTTTIVISHEWSLLLKGKPSPGVGGVMLEKPNQFLEIPNLKDTCLTNPAKCQEGLTIELTIKLTQLEENSVIFTSGGERPNEPGVTLIYRFGFVHVIVSTPEQSWYVSVSRKVIRVQTFTNIIVSWSKLTAVQLFVDKVLVGVSEPPQTHTVVTTSITNSLIIGGGNTNCVIQGVHIWLVHIEILIEINVINVQGATTTTKSNTNPSPPPATTQVPYTTTAKTPPPTPRPETPTSTVLTTSQQCPAGCIQIDACTPATPLTTERPTPPKTTPQPTTQAPSTQSPTTPQPVTPEPTTQAPTTEKPTTQKPPTAKPTTQKPTTPKPTTPKPTTTTPKPTTPKPTTPKPTTPKPTTPKPTTPKPTTPKPTTPKPTTPKPTTPKPTTPKPTTPKPTTPKPTTPKPTTTTMTTTTTTTTTTKPTTLPPCPSVPGDLKLTIFADLNGQARLMCSLETIPDPNIQVRFTWHVRHTASTWNQVIIEAPDLAGTLAVTELNTAIYKKQITCKAVSRWMVNGYEWCDEKVSNVLIPTIEITTTTSITVIEGGGFQLVGVVPTCPPSALCKPADEGRCKVEITTTFITEQRENKCTRDEVLPQAMLGVTKVNGAGHNACGLVITKDNWMEGFKFPVKATIDKLIDRDQVRNLKVSIRVRGEATKQSESIFEKTIRVTAKDRDRRAQCASVNDPHIKTFDGMHFNNYKSGEFVLYRHKELPYEVHALYRTCQANRPNGPTCNCGAAVRSGDDVITFNSCDRPGNHQTTIDVQMYKNGQLTPGTVITKVGCGQKYMVYLPNGIKVTIVRSYQHFINIFVNPTPNDIENSEGLCGLFNGNKNDDLEGENVKHPNRFNMKWKVDVSVSIFKGYPATSYPPLPTYCTCQSDQSPRCEPGLDVYRCNTKRPSGVDITEILIRQSKTVSITIQQGQQRQQPAQNRGKRQAETDEAQETMSNQEAETYCSEYLHNQTQLAMCESHLDTNSTQQSIVECTEDLEALGDKAWAVSHLEHLLDDCMENAGKLSVLTNNDTDVGDNTPMAVDTLLQNLCLEDCGQHGSCSMGFCECDEGWAGDSCEISKSTRPEVFPASGACDILTSSCSDIKIDGDIFVQSPNLSCIFRYTESAERVLSQGDLVSTSQIVCPEPETRFKGKDVRITVSNDGVRESEHSYLRVVYKSSCQACTVEDGGDNIQCSTQETGVCVIGGECYPKNEKHPTAECYICDPETSTSEWSRDTTCVIETCPVEENNVQTCSNKGSSDDEDLRVAVIILAVLAGLLALVAVCTTCTIYRARRARQPKLLQDDGPTFDIFRKNVTDPTTLPPSSSPNPVYNNAYEE